MRTAEYGLKQFRIFSKWLNYYIFALLFLAAPGLLLAETLNVTTYYPAPYGAYPSMLTTSDAVLARGANTRVHIGSGAGTAKLNVYGQAMVTGAMTASSLASVTTLTVRSATVRGLLRSLGTAIVRRGDVNVAAGGNAKVAGESVVVRLTGLSCTKSGNTATIKF